MPLNFNPNGMGYSTYVFEVTILFIRNLAATKQLIFKHQKHLVTIEIMRNQYFLAVQHPHLHQLPE